MKQTDFIEPAKRISNISEYYFSVKLQEVAKMNAEGKNVIGLGVGSPDLPPSRYVVNELCKVASCHDVHGYQPYSGIPELKQAYADWYKKSYDVELAPSEVLPLIGSKEGIMHITLAFLNEGDGVLVPNPGYPTYRSVSQLMGAEVVPYNLLESDGWMPDFETLEQMDLANVKLMWVNYPNMPTGANATKELFEKLVSFGKKHSIVICHDNPYSFILNDKPMSILQIEGAKESCIELNSMSKSHNMAGWRMGMLASNEQFVQWILKVKSNIDSGQFRPMQMAAIKALAAPKQWYDNMNLLYEQRRIWAEKIMTILRCKFDETQVGLFVWAKIPDYEKGSEELTNDILYNAHVFITPGFIFGSNGDRYIRISLGSSATKIKEAYERIADYLVNRNTKQLK
ncbi:MAG TPA: aminotransferase class I/II-fold pyridoxal phosphate-dependent enzyme [Dysgonamonadaceae bacterium]|nr:aminotransferase class I/II-fold pyridoxal phosphate-dependent enzyme [Dysgonamonadaceae bacterium]